VHGEIEGGYIRRRDREQQKDAKRGKERQKWYRGSRLRQRDAEWEKSE
jgi:hypothetical protein